MGPGAPGENFWARAGVAQIFFLGGPRAQIIFPTMGTYKLCLLILRAPFGKIRQRNTSECIISEILNTSDLGDMGISMPWGSPQRRGRAARRLEDCNQSGLLRPNAFWDQRGQIKTDSNLITDFLRKMYIENDSRGNKQQSRSFHRLDRLYDQYCKQQFC